MVDSLSPLPRRQGGGSGSARSLLLTILGEYVLPSSDPVWTSALVEVMAGLDVEEKAARQALARTAADGLIAPLKHGRQVQWELTNTGRRLLTDGAQRIYSFGAERTEWDGQWLLVLVTVPESRRDVRYRLRTQLT